MEIREIVGFNVLGVAIRTCNSDEMNPETAQIESLWQTFYSEVASKLSNDTNVYGVYTNYDSDHNGFFDVIAGAGTLKPDMLDNTTKNVCNIVIQSGKYLAFSATGKMPETVIMLWQEVWQYFEQQDCAYERAYTTDFEYYKSDHENKNKTEQEIEISIAIM